jgi:hypothetical protein
MRSGDRVTYAGLLVVGAAAAVMSFAALAGLAGLAGVAGHVGALRLAWLFPVAVDAYAATSSRVWLRPGVAASTRAWARANALAAIGLSVAGNAVYHELTASGSARIWVVVIVAAVPPLMLGAAVHTAVLVTGDRQAVPPQIPPAVPAAPVPVPSPSPAVEHNDRDKRDQPRVDGESRPGDRDERSAATGTDPARRLELVSPKTASASSRGEAAQRMREHWVRERAAGREPSGAELDRVAGTKDYGRRVIRELLREEEQQQSAAAEVSTSASGEVGR